MTDTVKLAFVYLCFLYVQKLVAAQTCADGVDAFVECTGVCQSDPTLNCEQINGKGYCCGYATTTAAPATTPSPNNNGGSGGNCQDVVPEECKRKTMLCTRFEYKRLMTKYCSLTCKFCTPSAPASNNNPAPPPQSNQPEPSINANSCSDSNTRCGAQKGICDHPKYQAMMAAVCKATCGKC
ncbi:unnamed protein product [Bursaphelenchus okinawaensis]|uniref:ShKT domain-containing protein n=1 Tax=Bursaphelenchus okinawaensis TaxID=465554 RepID=A0A811K156_9BILA|nr:unnamed protein product [Bursaphelenchus okinawaensis]CAG9088366.1 unnamed protein product [Bursaphelenchus okinawaensis]